jgi:oligopeptide transport system ATP-binding protein
VPRLDSPGDDVSRRRNLRVIKGLPPNLARLPKGCPFAPRCDYAMDRCRVEKPMLEKVGEDHYRACFYPAAQLKRPV